MTAAELALLFIPNTGSMDGHSVMWLQGNKRFQKIVSGHVHNHTMSFTDETHFNIFFSPVFSIRLLSDPQPH